jgi:hypothetical protein
MRKPKAQLRYGKWPDSRAPMRHPADFPSSNAA